MTKINKKKRKIPYIKYFAAASITLLISLPFVFQKTNFNFKDPTAVSQLPILPGSDKAILTLEDGKQVVLEEGKPYNDEKLNSDGKNIIYKKNKSTEKKHIAYNYLTIPRGGQFYLQLSDGTSVWLNSESKLKYPANFIKGAVREVELVYGEAYFDVSPSSKHNGAKFKVNTKVQDIEVLGTEFNIKAYNNDENILTTLVEGKVSVSNGVKSTVLEPGFQSKVNIEKDNISVLEVNVLYETAWRYGFFRFKDKSLNEMLSTLGRWYDVDVIYKDETKKDIIYSGVLKRAKSIEELLNSIQKTGNVEFEIKNKQIIVK